MIKLLPPNFKKNSRRYGILLFLIILGTVGAFALGDAYTDAGLPAPTVTSDKDDYVPGEIAHITGSGWKLDQQVHVEFLEEPDFPDFHIYDVNVNSDGSWQIDYPIEQRHLGVRFYVNASGKTTGSKAQTIFTDAFAVNSISPASICPGSSITINYTATANTASTPFTAELSNSSGTFPTSNPTILGSTSLTGNRQELIVSIPRTITSGSSYKIRMISSDGKVVSVAPTQLTINTLPTSSISTTTSTAFCEGGSVLLTSTTANSYQWNRNGIAISEATSRTYSATESGNYSVTVTNANDCPATSAATTVTVHDAPNASISIPAGASTTLCPGGSVSLNASTGTGYTYQWYKDGSNIPGPSGRQASCTAGASGKYTVQVTNSNGCSAVTPADEAINIIVNSLPATPTVSSNSPVQAGGTLILTASNISGATYSWTGPNGFTSSVQNPSISNVSGAASGTYSVTALVNGCTSLAGTVNVIINTIIPTSLSLAPASGTYGGTTTLIATLKSGTTNLSGKTVNFTVNGTSVGSAVTDVNGVATKVGISIAGINASTTAYENAIGASFTADASYAASSINGNLTVTPKAVVVTAAANQSKIYGTADPAFTFSNDANLANAAFTGALSRAAGNDVGQYAYLLGTLAAGSNYTLSLANTSNTFAITPAPATITLSDLVKTYNGKPQGATITTLPKGLPVTVTYNGSADVPTSAGTYNVVATLNNNNYSASNVNETLEILKAEQTITWTKPANIGYGTALSATQLNATVAGIAGGSSAGSLSYSPVAGTLLNAGTHTLSVTAAETPNYEAATKTVSLTVDKANQTITFAAISEKTFGDDAFAIAPTASSNLPVAISTTGNIAYNAATGKISIIGAGPTSVTAAQVGNDNYNEALVVTRSFEVKKANQTISIVTAAPSEAIYNTTFTVAANASSGLPVTYNASAPLINMGASFTMTSGTGTGTVTYSQLGNANYNPATVVTETVAAKKAAATITLAGLTGQVYDGNAKLVSTTTDPENLQGVTITYAGSAAAPTAAGSYAVVASLVNNNYAAQNATGTLVIKKAEQTINWAAPTAITYGTPLSTDTQLNATVVGVANGTAAGVLTYTPAAGTILDAGKHTLSVKAAATSNYNEAFETVEIIVNKADQVISWAKPANIVYGTALSATQLNASALGGATFNYLPEAGTILNAGPHTLTVSTPEVANYKAGSKSVTLVVDKALATLELANLLHTYDGTEKLATASTVPANLTGVSISNNGKTDAGTYSVTASLDNANYRAENVTADLVISKAAAKIVVTGYTGTYDALAHGATGTATGVQNEDLSNLLDLGNSFTNVPGGTANWSFAGNNNYQPATGTASIIINKATPTITLTIGEAPTYDGQAHYVTSATVAGIAGASLGNATVVYKQDAKLVATPTNAGDYTVTASYAGNANYNAAVDKTGTLTIKKADATIVVNGYEGVYDAMAHGATGSAKGVDGKVLSGLALGDSYTNVPGGTANWSFTGGTNYNDKSGTAPIVISARAIEVTADAQSKTFGDADPTFTYKITTGALVGTDAFTGSLIRVTGEDAGKYTITQGSLALNNNYTLTYKSADLTIGQATAIIVVNGYAGTYDALAHGATGTATGVKGEDLKSLLNLGGSFTNVPGGTANWSFAGNNNYKPATGTATITINARPVTITATAKSKVYGEAEPTFTYAITAGELAGTDAFTGSLTREAGNNVGAYAIKQGTVVLSSNYFLNYIGADLTITQRPVTFTANAVSKYCGTTTDPALTYQVTTGSVVGSDTFTGSLNRIAGEAVGTYAISSTLANSNYNITFVPANFTINGVTIDASASSNAVQLGNNATLSATVYSTTNTALDGINVVFSLNGKSVGTAITNASGVATYIVPGLALGFYKVEVMTSAQCGVATAYLPVYDPNGAFVTGGGWFNSPVGAYKADANMTGKANFGFNAQYKKGSNVPTGNTEFQFQAGNLNFKSTNYTTGSLVVAGARAIFKGTGTINGLGEYGFMISAIDGSVSGGGGTDKFRMKIWKTGGEIVYDNEMNIDENTPAITTLGGGSVVIHDGSAKKLARVATESEVFAPAEPSKLSSYPNPFRDKATIAFTLAQDEDYKLDLYDTKGALVKSLPSGKAKAGTQVQVNVDVNNTPVGVYILRLSTKTGVQNLRMVRE